MKNNSWCQAKKKKTIKLLRQNSGTQSSLWPLDDLLSRLLPSRYRYVITGHASVFYMKPCPPYKSWRLKNLMRISTCARMTGCFGFTNFVKDLARLLGKNSGGKICFDRYCKPML